MEFDLKQLETLLNSKKELLELIESTTKDMHSDDINDIKTKFNARQELLENLSSIDSQIKKFCEQDNNLKQALNNSIPSSAVAAGYQKYYKISMTHKAISSRILKYDGLISSNLGIKRAETLEKIKQINEAYPVSTNRYQKGVSTTSYKPIFIKKDKYI